MPRYDPETIAALAEGRLEPEEAAALEREIAGDPVASADLAAQRLALEALAAAPPAELTPSERTELRAAVADALGIVASDPIGEPRRRTAPWASLGIAAAALAALVAIVPVVGLLSTGGSGDDADSFELAAEAPTTAQAVEEEARSAAASDEAAGPPAVGAADADDAPTSGGEPAAESSAFASSTTTVPRTTTAVPAATTTETEATTTLVIDEEALAALTAELEEIKNDSDLVDELAGEALAEDSCWEEDGLLRGDPSPPRYTFVYENEQVTAVIYFERDGGVAGPFQVWGVLPDCADLVVIP
ncbi:MAG: hypothetical protein V3V29_04250 [Acidimicrobiia bacterium]